MQEIRKQVAEISDDVQALSHELHSSTLEYVGVIRGIRSWCEEFGVRQKLDVVFSSDPCTALPLEVGICLLRVLQEALHNAVKYSGVKRIEVQIAEHSNAVHFTVRDLGNGFDVQAAKRGSGLGLISMQERVRLVGGTMTVESKPRSGTSIHVDIPMKSEHAA